MSYNQYDPTCPQAVARENFCNEVFKAFTTQGYCILDKRKDHDMQKRYVDFVLPSGIKILTRTVLKKPGHDNMTVALKDRHGHNGWLYSTDSDIILYLIPEREKVFIIKTADFVKEVQRLMKDRDECIKETGKEKIRIFNNYAMILLDNCNLTRYPWCHAVADSVMWYIDMPHIIHQLLQTASSEACCSGGILNIYQKHGY